MQLNQPNDNFVEGFVKQCNAMGVDPELLITEWVKQGAPIAKITAGPIFNKANWAGPGAWWKNIVKVQGPQPKIEPNAVQRGLAKLKSGTIKTLLGGTALAGAGGIGYAYGKENENIY